MGPQFSIPLRGKELTYSLSKAERIRDLEQLPSQFDQSWKIYQTRKRRVPTPRPMARAGWRGPGHLLTELFHLFCPALAIFKWAPAIRTF